MRRHGGPVWDYREDEQDFKNEVAEGMHALFYKINEKNASRAASDPAAAAAVPRRRFVCG